MSQRCQWHLTVIEKEWRVEYGRKMSSFIAATLF